MNSGANLQSDVLDETPGCRGLEKGGQRGWLFQEGGGRGQGYTSCVCTHPEAYESADFPLLKVGVVR